MVMKADKLLRVTALYQRYHKEKRKGGIVRYGPFWYGWYREDGVQREVYIGKELPKDLQWLLEGRYKPPGYKQWRWPAPTKVKRGG